MERKTISFNARVTPVKPLNEEFTLCKCYVMALGKNRNLSFISKDATDAALPSLFNIPVIGHLYVDDEGKYHMGGHDHTIVQDADGQYKFKSVCVPYGVVPQQDEIHYEDVQETNGETHTYLVADVILWTGRFPELLDAVYDEKTYFGQSMEINVGDYTPFDEDKNYTNILDFTYSALCLLGKSDDPDFHEEPCFPMARVDVLDFSVDDEKFVELMEQLKSELAFCLNRTVEKEVGVNEADTIAVEAVESTENVEATTLSVTEASEVPRDNLVCESANEAESSGEHRANAAEPVGAFISTYREKREALDNALPYVHENDASGVIHDISFGIFDFDDTHVFVEKCEYERESGYTVEHGRYAYTFNETDKTAVITSDFEKMIVKWLTQDELDQLEAQKAQYEELVAYKAQKIQKERETAIDAAISEFSDLEGNEAFATVVANRYSYESVDALKDACYIVRGKFSKPAHKRKVMGDVSVPIGTQIEPGVYEDFFARYGKRK